MEKGRLRREGESLEKNEKSTTDIIGKDEVIFDSFGNEIKVEKKKQLTDKEKKRELKSLQKQLKDGKKKNLLSNDEVLELEEKIEQMKNE